MRNTYFVTLEYKGGSIVRRTEVSFECSTESFLEMISFEKSVWAKSLSRPNEIYETHLIHAISVARI